MSTHADHPASTHLPMMSRAGDVPSSLIARLRLVLQGPLLAPGLAIVAALASRVPWLPVQLLDHDSVNFAHALVDFDPARHSPHLPGYPVYVALARIAHGLGASTPAALAWPGVLGAVASSALIAGWLQTRAGRGLAVLGALAWLALPDVWLADVRPLSDGLGAHLVVVLAVALALAVDQRDPSKARRWRWVAALMLGLLPGVRLSSAPIALVAVAWMVRQTSSPGERWRLAMWWAASVAAWAVPLVWLTGGPSKFMQLSMAFGHGHLQQWRGDGPRPAWFEGMGLWLGHLAHGGIAVLLTLTAWRVSRGARSPLLPWLAAMVMAYLAWLVAGQNPERTRHVVPLAALAAVAVLAVWMPADGQRQDRRLGLGLAVGTLLAMLVSLPRLAQDHQRPSPDVAAGLWLARQPAEGALWLGGSEIGVLRWHAPQVRSMRLATPADLQAALAGPLGRAPRLWLSSRTPGMARLRSEGRLELVAQFPAREGIDCGPASMSVYRLIPPMAVAGPHLAEAP